MGIQVGGTTVVRPAISADLAATPGVAAGFALAPSIVGRRVGNVTATRSTISATALAPVATGETTGDGFGVAAFGTSPIGG